MPDRKGKEALLEVSESTYTGKRTKSGKGGGEEEAGEGWLTRLLYEYMY